MAVPGMPSEILFIRSASVPPWKKTPAVRFGPRPPVPFNPWHSAQWERKIFAPAETSSWPQKAAVAANSSMAIRIRSNLQSMGVIVALFPGDESGSVDANAPQCPAGSDEESLQVSIAEGAVGNLVHGYGHEREKLAFGRKYVYSAFELLRGFKRWMRLVESRRRV